VRSKVKIEILNLLLQGPIKAVELFSIILDPYQNPVSRLEENEKIFRSVREWQKIRDQRKRFNRLVYLLKKDGIIESTGRKGVSGVISITKKGKRIAEPLENRFKYKLENDDCFKIVAFDIPEKQRGKRRWLREALTCLKFTMVQQSVWLGKSKIPHEFINDLIARDIFDKIEILTIDKLGSLNRLSDRID